MEERHANGTGAAKPQPSRAFGARVRRGLAVSIFTVVAAVLACEIGLRAADQREQALAQGVNRTNRRWMALLGAGLFEEVDDPVRHYAMRPGAEASVDGWTFRVSSHRTRGADFPSAKPPGERRLLCLGDSFAFGLWADETETLGGHLVRLANEAEARRGSGVTWRALELGVPGYHSGQQLAALEQDGLALDPDVVVLYFNTNDIVREGLFLSEDLGALYSDHLPLLPTALKRCLWRISHVYGWITNHYTRSFASLPASNLDPRVPWAHVRADNQAYTADALRRIAGACRERGIPLFFVDQPLLTWMGDVRRPAWPILPLVDWAEALRRELGLPGIDLLPFFRGYADNVDRFPAPPDEGFLLERYIADEAVQAYLRGDTGVAAPADPDFHFTGEGYGAIAELAYPLMRAEGMLP
jgi:lysophospholipase L1-like esterase